MPKIQAPQTLTGLAKILARHGRKAALLVSHDGSTASGSHVRVDVSGIRGFADVTTRSRKITIGTGATLGEILREIEGECGLLRQAISMTANPLIRNRVTLLDAMRPESPYFDVTTALAALEVTVKVQSTTRSRTMPITAFLEAAAGGLKSGEFPSSIQFPAIDPDSRVGFFRVQSAPARSTVSAAVRLIFRRNLAANPVVVVSSSHLIPVRLRGAAEALAGRAVNDLTIKTVAETAAGEILEMAGHEAEDAYERSLIEVAVSRALRRLQEAPQPA